MTDTITFAAGVLQDTSDPRVLQALVLPFGETGETTLGPLDFNAGIVTLPEDPGTVPLKIQHDGTGSDKPVGHGVSFEETPRGIVGSFRIADGIIGDRFLADHHKGNKKNISAEVTDMFFEGSRAIKGRLAAAAAVVIGAFPSAAFFAIGEPDETTEPGPLMAALDVVEGKVEIETETTPDEVIVHTRGADDTESVSTKFIPESKEAEDDPVTLPNTLNASVAAAPERGLSLAKLNTLYAQHAGGHISSEDFSTELKGQNGKTMFAALSDVKYDGTGGIAGGLTGPGIPQWLGEIWSATTYRQQVLPLFAHKDLTSLNFGGFKWTTKPSGGTWPGNKADVPSNTLVVAPVSGTAARYAIGHDIAREFVDFPVEGFFESYAAAVSEDYAKWADTQVVTAALAGASALTGDALTTLPGATGGTIGSAMSAIIDGAVAVSLTGTLPNFALVNPVLYKQMLKTPSNNVLGYLSAALGLDEGDLGGFVIRPNASLAANRVLVGAREAVTVLELPGAPIRIDALDLARGGVDKAAFGYVGVNINDSSALKLVTAATA